MRKIIILISITLFAIPGAAQTHFTILHTNDMHGQFQTKTSRRDGIKFGGFLTLNAYIQSALKELNHEYLLLDAGDFMTGNPICDIKFNGATGGALPYFLNKLGYDGLTLGNHEFDISVQNAGKLIKLCDFPVFSCNLFTADGELFTEKDYHIYQKGNLRIGVIGVMVHPLSGYLNSEQKKQVHTKYPVPIVDSLATVIDPETDVIIVLSHSGIEADREMAKKLGRQVDIIIGGHSHTRLNEPEVVNHKLIVQAASNCRYLGRLDIVVAADTIQQYTGSLSFLKADGIELDSAFASQIHHFAKKIEEQYGIVIGELRKSWIRNSHGESNIGNFITDCIRHAANSDFAVLNSGGIRQNLNKGHIRAIDVKNILPFNNQICIFEMTGKQVLRMIQQNARAAANNSFGILQVSGIRYQWKKQGDDVKILSVTIKGEAVQEDRKYRGASVDYVLANADKYFAAGDIRYTNLYMPLSGVVINSIKQKETINSSIEGRIIQIKN